MPRAGRPDEEIGRCGSHPLPLGKSQDIRQNGPWFLRRRNPEVLGGLTAEEGGTV